MKIALITACLAGVAHSKMAALALKKEAKIRGHEICVEEQGGHKIPVKISKEQIEQADVVIIDIETIFAIIITSACSICSFEIFTGILCPPCSSTHIS